MATRPQGYGDEFESFAIVDLTPLDVDRAEDFCTRLLRAWRRGEDPTAPIPAVEDAFQRDDVQALARSPLHVAILAMFVGREEQLPTARWGLFRRYFDILFDRELRKLNTVGVTSDHRPQVFELHARVGLALHVRAQSQSAARLSVRELRAMLVTLYRDDTRDESRVEEKTAQMLRFATERLVLIVRVAEGGYGFAIRSLQEFFAAAALRECEGRDGLRERVRAIACVPHWANVLLLLGSGLVMEATNPTLKKRALVLVDVCRSLNEGDEDHALCRLGSRLAIALLRETERYAGAWFHDPLWELALQIADAPVQDAALEWARSSDVTERGERRTAFWDDPVEVHEGIGALAYSWRGEDRGRRWGAVLERARALLDGGLTAWRAGVRLIVEALRWGDNEARELVSVHPPRDQNEARRLLWAIGGRFSRTTSAALDIIATCPIWTPPGWLSRQRWARSGGGGLHSTDLRIARLLDSIRVDEISVRLFYIPNGALMARLASVTSPASETWREIESLSAEREDLSHWAAIARFHQEPDPQHLADALDRLSGSQFEDVSRCVDRLAWPMAASLTHVDSADQLGAISAALRAGELGTAETWCRFEAAWRMTTSLDDAQWCAWIEAKTPWSTRADDFPVAEFALRHAPHQEGTPTSSGRLSSLIGAIEHHGEAARRALVILRELIWMGEVGGRVELDLTLAAARRLCDSDPGSVASYGLLLNGVLPDFSGPDVDGWMALLDDRGRRWRASIMRGLPLRSCVPRNLNLLINALNEDPSQWGLAGVLLGHTVLIPDAPLDVLHLPQAPRGVPSFAVAQWTLLSLLTSASLSEDLSVSVALLRERSRDQDFDYRGNLAEILSRRTRAPERARTRLRAALVSTTDEDANIRDFLTSALLAQVRRAAPYVFDTPERWTHAELPPPFIDPAPPVPMPYVLRSIDTLTGLRIFRETPAVDAPFPTPAPDRGQWLVLLGENGTGKTTLLRALALALASPEVASKQLHSRLPLLRNGGPAKLAFTFSSGTYRAEVHRADNNRTEVVVAPTEVSPSRPWVVAYGVRRGNALGEEGRVVDWGPEGDLHTLFDRLPALVVAQDWLLKLDRRKTRERVQADAIGVRASTPSEDLWNAVIGALRRILDVDEITAGDDDAVYVKPRGQEPVRLESLSDGYLTTAGWIVDLVARWVKMREAEGDVLMGDILGQMIGVVLVDEIDLHLHPRWQMRVLDDVRRFFPRLSFIVTTHNPLTLQSARAGEVFVVRRGDAGQIELVQRDIHAGYDVDRTLLELFGVDHTFDRETREMLHAYRRLRDEGVADEDPRRVEIADKLRGRLGTFADRALSPGATLDDKQRAGLERFRAGARRTS